MDFSPDGRRLAVPSEDNSLAVYELGESRTVSVPSEGSRFSPRPRIIAPGAPPHQICFSPDGTRIAVARNTDVQIVDADTGVILHTLSHPDRAFGVAWNPDGQTLAVGCDDSVICLWDTLNWGRRLEIRGHFAAVEHVAFNHDGRLLASSSWDRTSRLWDAHSGRELVRTMNHAVQFSSDGRWLGLGLAGTAVGRWEVAMPTEYRTLHPRAGGVGRVDISPDGRLAVSATNRGVDVWDLAGEVRVAQLPVGPVRTVRFTSAGDLIHAGETGIGRWPIDSLAQHAINHGTGFRCRSPTARNSRASRATRVDQARWALALS